STFREQRFTTRFTGKETFLAEHQIRARAILPGAAYLEMARVAGELAAERRVGRLSEVTWLHPLEVAGDPVEPTIHLQSTATGSQFQICSDNGAVVHVRGQLYFAPEPRADEAILDLAAIKDRCVEHPSKEDNYRFLRQRGFEYGPAFQAIET